MTSTEKDITIVIVAGPGDEPFVQRNIQLIRAKNSERSPHIVVIDNGKTSPTGAGITASLAATVLDGALQNPHIPEHYRGSYQHAAALNHFCHTQSVESRFLLVLDPDFYVIRDHWIRDVLRHMKSNHLTFFGAPWHPKWYSKYRYFPCVHHLWIDTHAVSLRAIDFTPALKMHSAPSFLQNTTATKAPFPGPKPLLNVLRFLLSFTVHRRYIGTAYDTGYRLYRSYHHSKEYTHDILQPTMQNVIAPYHLRYGIGKWLEKWMPDAINFIPKKPNYFTSQGFTLHGLPDVEALGWEEFLWENSPFGFHLRRFNRRALGVIDEVQALDNVLERIPS